MSSDQNHILDTGVLLYFLLAEESDLLLMLLGTPLTVPLAVYDPSEPRSSDTPAPQPGIASEMRAAIRYHEDAPNQLTLGNTSARVRIVDELYDRGDLVTTSMSTSEQEMAADLASGEITASKRRLRLAAGEAACVAIAVTRDWIIVTDDGDALRAMDAIRGTAAYPYERIRRLLTRAAAEGIITRGRANELHAEMRMHGFWDKTQPFPDSHSWPDYS